MRADPVPYRSGPSKNWIIVKAGAATRARLMERSDGDYLTTNRLGDCGAAATNDL
jgi:hypothetical protein